MKSGSSLVSALTRASTVFAVVLVVTACGILAIGRLPIQAFPTIKYATIDISTVYYGADPETIEGFISSPLEQAVSPAKGIDFVTSASKEGQSEIVLHLTLDADPAATLAQVQSLVNAVLSNLPSGTQSPAIVLNYGDESILDLALTSATATGPQMSEYALRVLKPEIATIPGVRSVSVNDSLPLAMRLNLDPYKMTAYGLTAEAVRDKIAGNNYVAGVGTIDGDSVSLPLTIASGLGTVTGFRNLVVGTVNGSPIHIRDIGSAEIGTSREKFAAYADGVPGIFLDVVPNDGANIIQVAQAVKNKVALLQRTLPPGIALTVNEDDTEFTRHALREVLQALAEALLVVSLIVFVALSNIRSALIPVIAVPLALLGSLWCLSVLGYSINELTLLALVLSVGLVVDDAIIVVERHERHLESGFSPHDAADRAVSELLRPIVSMTIVLAAAYLPIALLPGIAGVLFREFATTLVASVSFSALIAVTVSPLLCRFIVRRSSHVAGASGAETWRKVLRSFDRLQARSLANYRLVSVCGGLLIVATVFFFVGSRQELAPQEDQGYVHLRGHAAPEMSFAASRRFDQDVLARIARFPYSGHSWNTVTPASIRGGISLTNWSSRPPTADAIDQLRQALHDVTGFSFSLYQSESLPTEDGDPVEFVVEGAGELDDLTKVTQEILAKMKASGLFAYLETSQQLGQPKSRIVLDRAKLADFNLDVQSVSNALSPMLSGSYINYFNYEGRSYKVISAAERDSRKLGRDVLDYPVATVNGQPVLLRAVAHLETTTGADVLRHFQGQRAITISGELAKGVSRGQVADYLADVTNKFPKDYSSDISGPMREYTKNQKGYAVTLLLSIAVVYLTLASFYNSLTDPIIILVSVPTSLSGALLFVWLGLDQLSVNLYTDVGLLTLIGLISKHGILLVEVANEQQDLGRCKRDAILVALDIRLRPILMTSAAMIIGSLPLLFIGGPGSAARSTIGCIVIAGLGIGTFLTLLIVPAFYMLLAKPRAALVENSGTSLIPADRV
ncbi:efflux RND transporter permease subunit [Xanthomonas campestris pv. phormiicola]|nr:efflux RND transporter permease subunit [Xanthomonas campestris pv. phormiicola]UYC16984.1 efflux RND transporter permease subunit [Xanthomonas campestris pv. phormiicola]